MRSRPTSVSVVLAAFTALVVLIPAVPASAQVPPLPNIRPEAPWNGNPISAGLGPTYNDPWCAGPEAGTSIANQQSSPLALIPQEAIGCTLDKIQAEADAAGIPKRMSYSVIGQSAGGHDIHGVIVNALETDEQRRDFERWQQIREIELDDPERAQELLAEFGDDVKMPVFIQGNIHGNEEEGADAIMQILRDVVTSPSGESQIVDDILDHTILVMIPMDNPDGRLAGTRSNSNNFDMNRDWLVQSQAEVRASIALQQEWLAPVGLDLHGYVSPTLIDGVTKPHNPGIDYDTYLKWNQPRLDANESALGGIGMAITRPVNHYNSAGARPGHPYIAEGWDDWGPFYTQTYMALYGVDSSTVEMCSSPAGGVCDGRLGSKTAQYVAVYSSLEYWLSNRNEIMHDQLANYLRGVSDDLRPECCAEMLLRGFTEDQHDWMSEYPTAYVIPRHGAVQRSDGEADRMAQWLLDNGIKVTTATEDFEWNGQTYRAGSYIVWMNQALRGIALTALSAGQDISERITQLYATPAAWSHGLLWGADVIEVPRGDESFEPQVVTIEAPNPPTGGIVGGIEAPADWYSVTLGGVSDHRAISELLQSGIDGAIAEGSFETTTGGPMPAGSLIFPNDPATAAAIDGAGAAAGLDFERSVGEAEPDTTELTAAPKVAILVNSANPAPNDTSESLRAIFGSNASFLSMSAGPNSIQTAEVDPLLDYDVIYNTGQGWPSNQVARDRLTAFFERGGGYIATNTSSLSFLTGGALVQGSFTQGSQSAYGGIAKWTNVGGMNSPVTGAFPGEDYLYLPSNVTYFTATPTSSNVDGQYHPDMSGTLPNGPSAGFVSGLWRARTAAPNSAPVIVRGATTLGSRYIALATNPFSRHDAEREWLLIAQAALWSDLTDDSEAVSLEASFFGPVGPGPIRGGIDPLDWELDPATVVPPEGTRASD